MTAPRNEGSPHSDTAASGRRSLRRLRSGALDIAYQVFGDRPVDIVGTFAWVSHLDATWELAESVRFLERLAGLGRVIWFDKRGTGMSDRVPEPAPVEVHADDVIAVSALEFVSTGEHELKGVPGRWEVLRLLAR